MTLTARCVDAFKKAVGQYLADEAGIADALKRSRHASLEEEVRQLLLQAAYVELALATGAELFDEHLSLDFSDQAIVRLKRQKYPFAPAMKAVSIDGLRPSPDDGAYVRLTECKRDVLEERFQAIRNKLGEALTVLGADGSPVHTGDGPTNGPASEPQVSLYTPMT